jgi:hypothetical protein
MQLHIAQPQISNSPLPGKQTLDALVMKDRRVFNTTLTTQHVDAPALPLPFNSSIHQYVPPGQVEPAVGPVYHIEELALTLYNIQKVCGRLLTLLPSPFDGSGVFNWGQVPVMNYTQFLDDPALPAAQSLNNSSSSNATANSSSNSSSTVGGAVDVYGSTVAMQQLPASWPPANGYWLVQCPLQFQGTPMLDLGFVRGMFKLQGPTYQPGSSRNSSSSSSSSELSRPDSSSSSSSNAHAPGDVPRNAGLGVSNRRPLMQFAQMHMRGLPQGDMPGTRNSSSSSSSSRGGVQSWQAAASIGGSSLVSALPAEAYTHLLWFVTR